VPGAWDETPEIPGKHPADRKIAALAKRQHGVIAHRQLVALGLGRGAIEHRISIGRLHRIHRGVYAVGHSSLSRKGIWMAAVLASGPGATLSHRSAAALWGLRRDWWKTDVTVRSDRRSRRFITVHRTRLDPAEITVVDGIPVTTVARTLFDLASVLDRDQVIRAIEESERRQLFDLRAVEAVLARAGRRAGTAALRAALAGYRDPAPIRSDLERDFLALVRDTELPEPRINVLVEGFEVDAFWPRSKLVVELDGRGFHSSPRAFEADRARDAALQRAGYRVIRITHRRLHTDPRGVVELIGDLAA
jgi:very-short-patch-repair endonuclease